jgi:hypothetical protein
MTSRPEQSDTEIVSIESIMRSARFAQGVKAVRAGQPARFDDYVGDWEYERGRLFASLAPISMPVWINGKLNPRAIALLRAAFARGLVL